MDKRDEVIKELENIIEQVKEHGAERMIVVLKTNDQIAAGWVEVDLYNFGGMMIHAGQMIAANSTEEYRVIKP